MKHNNCISNKKSVSSQFLHSCDAKNFYKRHYSVTNPRLFDPIGAGMMFFKSKSATAAAASCPTPSAMYPDVQLEFGKYVASSIKGMVSDLTAPILWQLILGACTVFLVGYSVVSVYKHAIEIYQIYQFYHQIAVSAEHVQLLNHQFEILNHFNRDAAVRISKLTFNFLDPDSCQLIVKYCIHNSEYSFHGVLMDISNSNMI